VWEPVVRYNLLWAYHLWATKSVIRDGHLDYRRWSPWFGYGDGWATHPRCWVWHHEVVNGVRVPKGPWVKAGMFLHKAIRGVANRDLLAGRQDARGALEWAKDQAASFGCPETWCAWDYNAKNLVYFIPEHQPVDPPTSHENWGYPVPNDGR
jgi:hypothetical protein